MPSPCDKTTLNMSLLVENDLEVDNDGKFHVVSHIYLDDSDDSTEIRVDFDHIIDNIIDFTSMEKGASGYGQLYLIAHELDRHASNLRDVAGLMEDKFISDEVDYDSNELI